MRAAIFVVIACALAVGVLCGDMKEKTKEAMKKCSEETGVDLTDVKKVFSLEGEPEQKIKCFHACMGKQMGAMVDGKFDKDKSIEMLPAEIPNRDQVVAGFEKCSGEQGSDDCETAYLVFKCLVENKALLPRPE